VTDLAVIDALSAKLKGTTIDLLVKRPASAVGRAPTFVKINYRAVFGNGVMRRNSCGPLKCPRVVSSITLAASRLKKDRARPRRAWIATMTTPRPEPLLL